MAEQGPDLVQRMIDARDCLRGSEWLRLLVPSGVQRGVAGALRWLDEGIEEGLRQREMYGALRQLVAGEQHVCTCDDTESADGCSRSGERCRFETALRRLVGVEEDEAPVKPPLGQIPYLPMHDHTEGLPCHALCPVKQWEAYRRRVGEDDRADG